MGADLPVPEMNGFIILLCKGFEDEKEFFGPFVEGEILGKLFSTHEHRVQQFVVRPLHRL